MPQNNHPTKKIWIAGHRGMVGSALMRALADTPATFLTIPRTLLDLRDQSAVKRWVAENTPDEIYLAAATVGGIEANRNRPADFLYDNMMIAANVMDAAAKTGVKKLLYLGSSCIYPRDTAQPISESALLTGPLEPTNEAYALAKIAGIKLCQSYRRQYGCNFIAAMPCNLYGPGDSYDAQSSHVIPALILKFEQAVRDNAKTVTLWGSGKPLREFLHVNDLARALLLLMQNYDGEGVVNIGSGTEITIADLAATIARLTGYRGDIVFDPAMPDGTPRKLLDSTLMRNFGWLPQIGLEDGLRDSLHDFHQRSRDAA